VRTFKHNKISTLLRIDNISAKSFFKKHAACAIENLKDLGFVALTDSIHWRETFPEYGSDDSTAICLRGARIKEGITKHPRGMTAYVFYLDILPCIWEK
jgi:hypothetical protein